MAAGAPPGRPSPSRTPRSTCATTRLPSFGAFGGTLLAPGPAKGTGALSFAVSDRGGGVRREQLLVDGQLSAERNLACDFGQAVPCPRTDSGSFALDTTQLREGDHKVEVVASDATLANATRYGPFTLTVDNVPPPAATLVPRVYGTPVAGTALSADDGAWTGDAITLSRRWQRSEADGWEDIPGATKPTFTPDAGDTGHLLRFHVRATNQEGTGDAYSEATAAVAAPPRPNGQRHDSPPRSSPL